MCELKDQETDFIVTLTDHRIIGQVLVPFLMKRNKHGAFHTIVAPVINQDINNNPSRFTDEEKKLVRLIESFNDQNLAQKFSRKKGSQAFFAEMSNDFFNKHITPFIDKKIAACFDILKKGNIKLYRKPANYNNIYEEDLLEVKQEPAKPVFYFDMSDEGLNYHIEILHNDQKIDLLKNDIKIISNFPCSLLWRNQIILFEKLTSKRLKPFFEKPQISIPANVTEKYLKTFVAGILKEHQVKATGFDIVESGEKKKALIMIRKGLDHAPLFELVFKYGNQQFRADTISDTEVELIKSDRKYSFLVYKRDFIWEAQIIKGLKEHGLKSDGNLLYPQHTKDNFELITWLNQHKVALDDMGISTDQETGVSKYYTGERKLNMKVQMEGDWFDVYAVVEFGSYKIPFIRLKKNILSGKREFILPNGEIVILPREWFTSYQQLLPHANGNNERLKFSKHHFKLINDSIKSIDKSILDKISELQPDLYRHEEKPEGLNAELRTYQQEGYSWLKSLYHHELGGCLADDMGLGKTLQALTLLLAIKNQETQNTLPAVPEPIQQGELFETENNGSPSSIIIVPTSLIHNWHNEVIKFTPQLKVYRHIGVKRKKVANLKDIVNYYDIIITTYGTIRNDYKLFKDLVFNYIILDESQYIKNAGSKTYKAVCELQSKHRLVLTGTPIENSLSDLWSQINFLNGGLLGSLKFFQQTYLQPIEKNNDKEKQKQLKNLIRPFILRRTKDEVAKDLPPLMEQTRFCEMTDAQKKAYEHEKSLFRNQLLKSMETVGMAKSSFLILQGLTKLRQLANHPALLQKNEADSGKFNEVMRSLENLVAENHKVLIFSSFVSHLRLYENAFAEKGWDYCMLTGQTSKREEVIREFQENAKKQLFLISLKAGGVGLNLTSADYIFILDPWWNPASENQAVSRAHRIGQNKKVFVYRFISEETIEEKIQALQEKKTALADLFINSNNPFKSFSEKEIVELFD